MVCCSQVDFDTDIKNIKIQFAYYILIFDYTFILFYLYIDTDTYTDTDILLALYAFLEAHKVVHIFENRLKVLPN